MTKKLTIEEFVEKAKSIHGNTYDYSLVDYKNNKTKVTIICPTHGKFKQGPNYHLKGSGCFNCNGKKKLTTEVFIEKARLLHGNQYDYSLVDYKNNKTKVTIICPTHGKFKQVPDSHLRGKGCLKCRIDKRKLTTEVFIEKARLLHGNQYDYSLVDYKNNRTKVTIICPTHGKFKQIPSNHLRSQGCLECVNDKSRSTTEEFIEKARLLHGNTYDYSLVDYKNNKTKVTIICPTHGKFKQGPNIHLQGHGCPSCSESKGEKRIREYLEANNIKFKPQFSFKNSTIEKNRFDFCAKRKLIEYHGKQHYISYSFGSKKEYAKFGNLLDTLKRDLKKSTWCEEKRIPLLVIPFWDYDRIEEILDDWFAGNEPTISEQPELVKNYEPMREKMLMKIMREGY